MTTLESRRRVRVCVAGRSADPRFSSVALGLIPKVAAALATLAWAVGFAAAGQNVVVKHDAVEPTVLRTTTGERVDFVNRTGHALHIEFSGDVAGHEVVQVPTTGPFWVVFHRPGTHPYVVHVYEPKERALEGVVEVTEDPQRRWEAPTCNVTVMGVCLDR